MNPIIQILIDRDGLSEGDARLQLDEAVTRVYQGDNPEDVLLEEFGLEPDYIFDLIGEMTFLKRQGY